MPEAAAATDHLAQPLADPDTFAAGLPYELFRWLRDEQPVAWTPEPSPRHGFWSVTRHADIAAVSRDWASFSSSRGVSLEELDDDQLAVRTSLIDIDPPRHTALRKVISGPFAPRVVNGYEAFLRGIVATTLDHALPQGTFDFVSDVSSEIPVRVLARMLSVPDADRDRIVAWGDRLVGNTDPELADVLSTSDESDEYRLLPFRSPAALEVFEYGRAVQAQRRHAATGDLTSLLVEAEIDGAPLSQLDLDNIFLLLIIAGQETTRQAITLALLTLAEHPDVLTRLQERPQLLSGPAVDELLRWAPPVLHMRRTATRDVTLHDVPIRAGDKLALWYAAGNRDERAIADPDRLDVTRPNVDLLTFGKGGPHYCMGSFLAKLEIRVTLEELVARLDTVRLAGRPERLRSNFINGIKRMPVTVSQRGAGS